MFLFCVHNKLFRIFRKGRKTEKNRESKKTGKRIFFIILSALMLVCFWGAYFYFRIPDHSYCEKVGEYSLEAETEIDREDFFAQFGFSAEYVSVQEILIPCIGESFEKYNEMQKSQGLDLSPYMGEKAFLYTYKLNSFYEGSPALYGFLIVYHGRVVGAHISDGLYPGNLYTLTMRHI